MGSQHVSLHWNGHKDNMITMFKQLLSGEFLVDVTLESEGHHLKAHKIILSASSPFFQNLFVDNPCHHPTVVLTNIIKYENMKAIIDFVYQGKIEVSRERLEEFLKSAERLKIKGLSTASQDEVLAKNNEINNSITNSLMSTVSEANELQMQITSETNLTFLGNTRQCVSSVKADNSFPELKIVKVEGSYGITEHTKKTDSSWEDIYLSNQSSPYQNCNSKTWINSNGLQEINIDDAISEEQSDDFDPMQLSVKVELDSEVALNSMQICLETEELPNVGDPDPMQVSTKVEESDGNESSHSLKHSPISIGKLHDKTNKSNVKEVVSLLNGPTLYKKTDKKNKREFTPSDETTNITKSSLRTLKPNLKYIKESASKYSNSQNDKKISSTGLRFSCNTCGRMFKWRSHLAIHQMSHMNERPIYCDVCGGMFMRKTLLKLHMKVHGKQKVYSCVICGKNFLTETNLVIHNRTHTGEKPYDCNICGKKFTQKGNLAGHLRTHIGERPYICNVCNKRFTQNVGLRKHLFFTHCIKA